MGLLKRTYAIPQQILDEFERVTAPSERSALVAEMMREWLDQQQLRQEVIEGCCDMADVYLATEREFHPLEEEVERASDERPD
jgi:metal-responsive CopG/Arc/MetJ family transcriptional regulator